MTPQGRSNVNFQVFFSKDKYTCHSGEKEISLMHITENSIYCELSN